MHRSVPLLAAAVLALPASSLAQEPSDSIPADSVRLLGGLTVSVARPAITTGGSSSVVVDLDSLGSVPAPSMEQVIRSMPLIQIRTNSRGEAQPALRGSEDRQIAIIMDGVPLTLGWDHRTDMSIIPLTAARSVTLVRGLSSVLYGPNTLGGVVEVDVARTERRVRSVDPVTLGFALDQTGGTNGSVTAGRLLDQSDGQWVFRGGVGWEDRPGFPLPGGLAQDPSIRTEYLSDGDLRLNSDTRRVDAFFTGRYRADSGAWASLSAAASDAERGVPPEAHQDAPRLWRYPRQRRLIAALTGGSGQRGSGSGEWDVEGSVGVDVGSTFIEQFSNELFASVDETEDSDDFVFSARTLAEHTLGVASHVRAAATYADISHDEVLTPGGANSYRQRLWSLGVESELSAGSGTTVTLGAALDGADTPESGDKAPVGRISDYGLRAGLSSIIAPQVLLHAGVSRRARFPSLRELYSGGLGRFEPNPDLVAETLVGSEVGLTASGGVGEFQLVGFHHRLADGIVRTSVTGADGIPRFRRVNQDQVRSTGLEVLVVGAMGRGTVSGDLTLQSVTGLDADGTEVDLEYEPGIAGKLGIDLPLPADLWGGGELRFVGEQQCENPEVGGLQPLPSSQTLDVSLRRSFAFARGGALSRVTASASLRNLTNAAVFDQCGLPQPGRFFRIQLQVR